MSSRSDELDRRDLSDWQESRSFIEHQAKLRRMSDLREAGHWEACFSKDNEDHVAQFARIVAELITRGWLGDYASEEFEGVRFLFVSDRAKKLFSHIPFKQSNSIQNAEVI